MLVIVPSRGRPENVERLIHAFHNSCSIGTELMVAVDEDDPKFGEYQDLLRRENRFNWVKWTIGPRLRMNGTLNAVALRHAWNYRVIGFMGDDHIPQTPSWDEWIYGEIVKSGYPIAYGNDLIQGRNLPTAVFMDSRVIQTLGYMAPPGLIHLYMDNFWLKLGEQIGAHYRGDIIIQHLHPVAGIAQWDDTYREANHGDTWAHDGPEFERYMREEFPDAVARLKSAGISR